MRILSAIFRPRSHEEPPKRPRLIWLENEYEIFRRARLELGWLPSGYHPSWHPEGETFVTIWPLRVNWSLWWMAPRLTAPSLKPGTPAELAALLEQHPPKDADHWSAGALVDPAFAFLIRHGEARQVPNTPVLEAGTRIIAGASMPDGCDGFDTQLVSVASGPWTGTLLELRIGRAGEPYLIARLGIVPPDEPIASDPARAFRLLERLRNVEASNPS